RNIMLSSDCQSCHKENEISVGPSYRQVIKKYQGKDGALNYLTEKIIKGGSGVWGEVAMPAHPTMKEAEARQIVQWIFSLAEQHTADRKSLPAKGTIRAQQAANTDGQTVLRITANYTNTGGPGVRPLSGSAAVYLKLKEE